MALIERHFLPFNRTASTNEERLYLSKIESLINEDSTSMSLIDFLRQISDYCCEFYYDNKIKITASEDAQESFVFKHAALSEAIFHIFTFISRAGINQNDSVINIKGTFVNKNKLPIITIEVDICGDGLAALGWSSGPPYVYNSLLSIYMLARENELFFNIARDSNKMLFILEPMFLKEEKELKHLL